MDTMRKNIVSDMIDKVSFVNYLPLLTRATSDSQEPIPGYVYQEIENISLLPEPSCQLLTDYLAQRLNRPSATVKIKVLKIMNHLILNGPRNFRQHLRKRDGSIKMATSYHEAPNPLTGTYAADTVRNQSTDVLQLLFDAQLLAADESPQPKSLNLPKLGGLGNSRGTNGKYEGFGSSPVTKEDSFADKMMNTIERWASSSDQTDLLIQEALSSSPGKYEPVALDLNHHSVSKPVIQLHKSLATRRVHIPGKAGGGWDDDSSISLSCGVFEEESGVSAESSLKQDANTTENLVLSEACISETNISLESSCVENFCAAGPLPCALADICSVGQRCTQLNVRDVVQTIVQVLETYLPCRDVGNSDEAVSGEVHLMRAMLLLEWLMRTDVLHHPTAGEMCCPTLKKIVALGSPEMHSKLSSLQVKAEKLLLIFQKLKALPV